MGGCFSKKWKMFFFCKKWKMGGSVGLTMWQMWQMPRASGLRGASGSRENFFQPVSSQVI